MFCAHLAQKVESWPFKPMVVGSIPTVGVFCARTQNERVHSVGFEPTHPKILRPERSALDRSAKNAHHITRINTEMTIVTLWSNRLIR